MANTGRKIVITLKEIDVNHGNTPTGQTKPNISSDPDYVDPYVDLTACPLEFVDTCPEIAGTGQVQKIELEFNLPDGVIKNPNIKKVRVSALNPSNVVGSTQTITLPNTPTPNYFHLYLLSLTTGVTYHITIEYLNASNAVVKSCSPAGLFTVT